MGEERRKATSQPSPYHQPTLSLPPTIPLQITNPLLCHHPTLPSLLRCSLPSLPPSLPLITLAVLPSFRLASHALVAVSHQRSWASFTTTSFPSLPCPVLLPNLHVSRCMSLLPSPTSSSNMFRLSLQSLPLQGK